MSSDSLWLALEATFSADRPTRQAAEEFLTGGGDCGCNTRGDWCALLLDFAVTPVTEGGAPSGAQGLASDLDVRVACAVFLKNSVSEKEWLGGESFSPECKSGIRDRLIGALCDLALADRVRKVLSSLLEHLHAYDWLRGEWPGLLPATLSALHSSLQGFDQFAPDFIASVAANASADFGIAPEAPADGQLSSTIKVIATCTLLLKLCCKVYDDPVKILIKDQDDHAATVVGPLGEVLTRLTNADWLRAVRDAKRTTATLDGTRMMPKDHSTWVHVVAASDEASYMAMKSAWYIAGNRIPVAFADETFFTAFQQATIELWRHCNDCVYDFRTGMLLSRRGEPLDADEVVVSTERPKSTYFWKLYKRVVSLSHRFLQSTITAKLVEVRLKPLAKAFVEQIAPSMLELALATIALHNNKATVVDVIGSGAFNEAYPPVGSSNSLASPEQPFTSKALIMSLEFVEVATGNQAMYGTIHEYAAPLLTEVLFDRLSITAAERELWAVNPVDFVRRLTDPRDDLWNPKICSASLMRQLCVPPKSFQDKTLIAGFAQHIQSVLVSAPQEITDATDFEEGSSAWFAALKLDACLYAMSQLRDAVSNAWPIAQVMLNFVAPLLNSSVGFLRARAVHVLASFLPKIEWPSAEDYHSVLERLLPLLRDPEVPVRIRTALGCSGFIRHPLAHDAVAPRVGSIIKDLLDVVKEMDSDSVVHAMRKIIKHYAATVAEWAVPLATALVEHFTSLHATIAERIAAQEENSAGAITKQSDAEGDGLDQDDVQDAIAAADELLATLATLTKSIPHAPEAAALFYQLQEIIAPVLSVLLSGAQNMGFMDIALRLLTRLVQRSDAVLPVTWDTFRSLHRVVCEGNAVDYFGHLVSPIDNFVSVDPTTFVAASVEATEAAASPAALLLEMCQCVLKQTAMLRRREVLPVFAITDIVFINAQHAKVDPEVAAAFARRYASSFAALPAQYYSDLQQRGRSAPQPAEWAIMTTGYLGVLLYTAKAIATPQELFSIFPPQQLFYVLSSMGELAPTAVNLRVYDRKVFIAAVLAVLSSAASAPDDAGVDVSSAAGALHTAFVMILQNAAVESCAVRAAVKKAAKFNAAGGNNKQQQHRDPYAMDDFTSDDEDDDSDESSADGDDGDDDDDELDGMDAHDQFEDDLGDEGSEVDEDDKAIRNYDHFATTVAAARKLAAKEAGLLDGEEEEEDEEELAEDHLDETDFSSPIDAYDEYASFGELLRGVNSSAWIAEVVNHALADYGTVANVLPSEMAPEAAVKALTKNGPPTLVHAADCNEGAAFGGDVVGPDVTVSLSDLLVAASHQRRFLTEHHISAKR